jgi:hypothetical protein
MPGKNPLMIHAILQVLTHSADDFGVGRHHAEAILTRWKENHLA